MMGKVVTFHHQRCGKGPSSWREIHIRGHGIGIRGALLGSFELNTA